MRVCGTCAGHRGCSSDGDRKKTKPEKEPVEIRYQPPDVSPVNLDGEASKEPKPRGYGDDTGTDEELTEP